jgi:ASC-1-like (ASCH) protein
MNIKFGERFVNARHMDLATGSVKTGDLIHFNGELLEVVTVQRDCPMWESTRRTFTMFTCKDASQHMVPIRDLYGVVEVFRPKKG